MKTKIVTVLTCLIALGIAYGTLNSPGSGGAPLPLTDKQIHFLAFLVLVFPLGWTRPDWAIWLVPVAFCYGALIEIIQPAVGRSGDLYDLLADGLGVIAGILPGQLKLRAKHRRT